MKKQPVTLTVPTPCHENWQAMTPADQGRFCNSCQKTVHDFTAKTDREVARYFEQAVTSSTCGRFRPDQLHRPLQVERPDGFGARLRALGLLVPGLLLGNWAQAQTQRVLMGKPAYTKPVQVDSLIEVKQVIMGMMAPPRQSIDSELKPLTGDTVIVRNPVQIITGKVLDASTGEALIGANVLIKGTQFGTVTDVDGSYELGIPAAVENPVLAFSYTGYETFSMAIAEGQKTLEVKMAPGAMQGEIVFTGVVAIRKDETLYRIAKRKAIDLFRPLRERREERKLEKAIAKQENPIAPVPEPAQPETPRKPLPEAMPVEVFPNPFSRNLNIRFDSPAAERLNIRLTDMQGRTVLLQTYEAMKGPQVVALDDLGAANLPSGQYLLELSSSGALRYAGLVVKE